MRFSEGVIKTQINGVLCCLSPSFAERSIPHAFSTRSGGVSTGDFSSMNLTLATGDSPDNVLRNSEILLSLINSSPADAVKTKQVHGTRIAKVGHKQSGDGILRPTEPCDGLVTDEKGLALMSCSADCSLAMLYDTKNDFVAVYHGGWRGVASDIGGEAVKSMLSLFSSESDIICALPPCIGSCCFETDSDVPEAMLDCYGSAVEEYIVPLGRGRYRVDLQAINAYSLARRGIAPSNIELMRLCTRCDGDFFSHRRSGTKRGVMAAVIKSRD